MDNLTRDVLEAQRLGYGCHYGRYKADHPHTRPVADDLPTETSQKKYELRKCKHCGNLFEPSHGGKQYCSESCKHIHSAQLNLEARRRAIANLPEKTCAFCGKTFRPNNHKQKNCSISCAQRTRWNGRKDRICPVCGERFHPNRSEAKYCGRACYLKDISVKKEK